MIPQAGIFVCMMLAGTACLVVWLLERGELGEEEERRRNGGEEREVVGLGDRRGIRDRIRDIYR